MCTSICNRLWPKYSKDVGNGQNTAGHSDLIVTSRRMENSVCSRKNIETVRPNFWDSNKGTKCDPAVHKVKDDAHSGKQTERNSGNKFAQSCKTWN